MAVSIYLVDLQIKPEIAHKIKLMAHSILLITFNSLKI